MGCECSWVGLGCGTGMPLRNASASTFSCSKLLFSGLTVPDRWQAASRAGPILSDTAQPFSWDRRPSSQVRTYPVTPPLTAELRFGLDVKPALRRAHSRAQAGHITPSRANVSATFETLRATSRRCATQPHEYCTCATSNAAAHCGLRTSVLNWPLPELADEVQRAE